MVLGGFSERRVFPARWQPTERISSAYPDSAGASKDERRDMETDAGVTRPIPLGVVLQTHVK